MVKNSKIKSIKAREILDSRENPTVEVDLVTDDGLFRDSAPSGASKGKYEVLSVESKIAVRNINKIIETKLQGKNPTKQKEIDRFLSPVKFGANATISVSMAVARAGAAAKNFPLYQYLGEIYTGQTRVNFTEVCPRPAFNIINGGAHAGNDLDFQEFMIVPQFKEYSKNLKAGLKIYQTLKEVLKKNFGESAIKLGDEGGFAPSIGLPEEALDLIQEAVKKAGYQNKIKIILDVAASQFYINGKYRTKFGAFTSEELLKYYLGLIQKYPIMALEDPFAENDWDNWRNFYLKIKNLKLKILLIGDDLTVTNPARIKLAHQKSVCNAVIIKPNQIGTVSETIAAAKLAKSFGWKIMVSHRSGETMDDFIADLAVGLEADLIKTGAPSKPERMVKYNRLLKIEEELYKD